MVYLKIFVQLITGISGLLAILLDYKWHDKRKKIFKTLRNVLIFLTIISLAIGIYITINDDNEKKIEIKSLKENLDTARNTLSYIKANGDTLKNQIKPFLELAKSKYPNLNEDVALDSLKNKIEKLDSNFFLNSIRVSQLDEKAKRLEQKTKIISSLEFRVFVDELTLPLPLSDKETSAGIQSVVALFDNDNLRYRFVTDFQFSIQQIQNDIRRINFIYKPESPDQILGKKIDLLSKMKVFVLNFSQTPEIFGSPNSQKSYLLTFLMYLNGIQITILKDYKLLNGKLYQGQINIPVGGQFSKIEKTYSEYIDQEIGR